MGNTQVHTVVEVEADEAIQISTYVVGGDTAWYTVLTDNGELTMNGVEFALYCAARSSAVVLYLPQVLKNET